MRCPLTFSQREPDRLYDVPGLYCLRSDCAWWDPECNECAVFALAKHFQLIADEYNRGRPWRPAPDAKAVKRHL